MSNDVNQMMDGRAYLGGKALNTFSSSVYKVEDDDGFTEVDA